MINPNNLDQLASELENILKTRVSTGLLNVLSEKQRSFMAVLIRKWALGVLVNDKEPVDIIIEMLDQAKEIFERGRYVSPKVEAYKQLKIYD